MISKGWEYCPFRDAYCRKAMCVSVESIEEYVRDNYPEEYAEMSLKEDFKALTVRVDVLEQKDLTSGELSEPYKGRTLCDDKLEDEIKRLQAKCRGLSAENAKLRNHIYWDKGAGKLKKSLEVAKGQVNRHHYTICELHKDIAREREAASRYSTESRYEIANLEMKLAEEKKMAWGASYSHHQTQNVLLKRSIEDLEGQLSRKQEAKDAVVGVANKEIRELRNRVQDLEELTTKADKCVVKQGAKIKDLNKIIDQLAGDQYSNRGTIKYLEGCLKRRNVKISRAKLLFKLILHSGLTEGLRNSIKEELQ
jgi:chromosome segregation ATPase